MSFFEFPYTRTYSDDLGWIIRELRDLADQVENKTIKYADPIDWNITSQYEVNTVVLDGTVAYLSKQAVPSGIGINDTDYWQAIFDIAPIVGDFTNLRNQISAHYEETYTATRDYNEGDWMFIHDGDNDLLYYALTTILTNGGLVPDVTVKKATVEDIVITLTTTLFNAIGDLSNLTTSDQTSIVNAINELVTNIGDLSTLTTSDQTSIVNAINELVTNIGDLSNLTTSDQTSIVNAINEVEGNTATNAGDITALDGRVTALENNDVIYYNVKNYGAVGDGATDDTAAVQAATTKANTTGGIVYFPHGAYKLTDTIRFTHYACGVMGENAQSVYIMVHHNGSAFVFGDGVNVKQSMSIMHIGIVNQGTASDVQYGVYFNKVVNAIAFDVIIQGFKRGFGMRHAGNTHIYSVGIVSDVANASGFFIYDQSVSTVVENCYVSFSGAAVNNGTGVGITNGDIADITIKYLDVANGAYAVYIDGSLSPVDYPPADIRLYDIVGDGQRLACIYISNINKQGNVQINGGWLNPQGSLTPNANCVVLNSAYNVTLTGVVLQQLYSGSPSVNGIVASNSYYLTVNGCEFLQLENAISLAACAYAIITSNTIHQYSASEGGTAIAADASSAALTIANNIVQGVSAAINIPTATQLIVVHNMFRYGTVTVSGVQTIYKDNIIAGTPQT